LEDIVVTIAQLEIFAGRKREFVCVIMNVVMHVSTLVRYTVVLLRLLYCHYYY